MQAVRIPISRGLFTIVDEGDVPVVIEHSWFVVTTNDHLYAATYIGNGGGRKHTLLHRFLMNPSPTALIDHIDGDGLNCRRSNMREATHTQNNANMRLSTRNNSGYKGVCWNKQRRKWQSSIRHQNAFRVIGFYDDAIDAALAYDRMALEIFGDFARFNFPHSLPIPEGSRSLVRDLTKEEISRTMPGKTKTGMRNIYFRPETGKYEVRFQVEKKPISFGRFSTIDEAVACASKARAQLVSDGFLRY